MFSHSSHFKKLIALLTIVALFTVALAPLTTVFAEGEEIVPPPESTTENVADPVPGPTPAPESTIEETASNTEPLTVTASTTQEATVENAATSTSDTGNNTVLPDGNASSTATTTETTAADTATTTASTTVSATIHTGDAVATANVITAVNVSSYNSSGLLLFLTNLLGGVGTIDFRELGFLAPPEQPAATSTPCSFVGCDSGLFTNLFISQNATVNTSVSVGANTGGNTAVGGSANITTGNAAAVANVVTVANSSFIDSNYLMLVFNQFGSWGNDVVLPGAQAFESSFGGGTSQGSGSVSINTNSNATVTNEVSVTADTGNNSASSTDGSATVVTGNATAGATVVNTVNTSLINSNAFVIIFRIHGNWSGSLFGLPPGVSWEQTPDGIALFSTPSGSGNQTSGGSLSASTTQNTTIHNAVEVYALTGNNKAEGGETSIATGDAAAAANVINIANSQVIGRNWLFAIVNIFGDWSGNIAFGRPDLWVAGSVDMSQNPAQMRDILRYTFTLKNNGDAEAHNGTLTVDLPASLEYVSSDNGGSHATGTVTWQLGTLAPKSTQTLTLDAAVTDHIGYGTSQITLNPAITSQEPDQNSVDNQDAVTVDVFRAGPAPVSNYVSPVGAMTPIPAIDINKVVYASSTVASSTVSYRVSLTNKAEGPAYQTVLFDTLRDPQGKVVFEKTWDVGDIAPHETVNVDYQVFFAGSSTPGLYTNEAYLKGLGGLPWSASSYQGFYITSRTATATIIVETPSHLFSSNTIETARTATSTALGGTLHGKSLLFGPYTADTGGSYGQLAGLGFAADSRRLLSLFPLFLALICAAYYISRNGEVDWTERRELVLDFLRSHHLFFW